MSASQQVPIKKRKWETVEPNTEAKAAPPKPEERIASPFELIIKLANNKTGYKIDTKFRQLISERFTAKEIEDMDKAIKEDRCLVTRKFDYIISDGDKYIKIGCTDADTQKWARDVLIGPANKIKGKFEMIEEENQVAMTQPLMFHISTIPGLTKEKLIQYIEMFNPDMVIKGAWKIRSIEPPKENRVAIFCDITEDQTAALKIANLRIKLPGNPPVRAVLLNK